MDCGYLQHKVTSIRVLEASDCVFGKFMLCCRYVHSVSDSTLI